MVPEVDTTQVYSSKARHYARYRWDYAPAAVDTVTAETELSSASVVADLGSGTGILSRHFVGKVAVLFAVEPNPHMRCEAEKALKHYAAFRSVVGKAEETTLPSQSVDVITVGQSLHWFEPIRARTEFDRILRPEGWLVVLNNHSASPDLHKALQEIFVRENGVDLTVRSIASPPTQPSFYYGGHHVCSSRHRFVLRENWESFFGSLLSDSSAPHESHELFSRFQEAARGVFEAFANDGCVEVQVLTELYIGQMHSQ